MFIQTSARRLAVIVAMATMALSAAILSVSATSAYALQSCPTTAVGGLPYWIQTGAATRGIVLCRGAVGVTAAPNAYVQIVNLSAGAKIRLVSTVATGTRNQADGGTGFQPRTAKQWYTGIKAGSFVSNPPGSRLFSTTNGAFFINTSGSPTALSMPEKTGGSVSTRGWVVDNLRTGDAAWNGLKAIFGLSTVAATQGSSIQGFPTHYTSADVANYTAGCWECVVGFAPTYHVPGSNVTARRTYVGRNSTSVYILSASGNYTEAQANSILSAFGATSTVQLDGGGSTQMYVSDAVNVTAARAVPEVLAVYYAP